MRIYVRVLAGFYLLGGIFHLLDIFGLRLKFDEMSRTWKVWIVYLLIFDLLAAIGLWRRARWGIGLFFLVSTSQLIAYLGFQSTFGSQWMLVAFHAISLAIFFILYFFYSDRGPSNFSTRDRLKRRN